MQNVILNMIQKYQVVKQSRENRTVYSKTSSATAATDENFLFYNLLQKKCISSKVYSKQYCQRIKHLIQACQPISLSRYFSTRNHSKRKFRQNYTVVAPSLVNSWYLPINGVTRGSRPVFVALPSSAPAGTQQWQDCLSTLREKYKLCFVCVIIIT